MKLTEYNSETMKGVIYSSHDVNRKLIVFDYIEIHEFYRIVDAIRMAERLSYRSGENYIKEAVGELIGN